jgi:hypothetical protein
MLSIPEIKKLMEDETISDKEAVVIRDACQGLVELAFELIKKNRSIIGAVKVKNIHKNQPLTVKL